MKRIFVLILASLIGGALTRACDHSCPSGYTWVSKNGNNGDDGSCVADPSSGNQSQNQQQNQQQNQSQNQGQQQVSNGGSASSSSVASGGSASVVDNSKLTNTSNNTNIVAPTATATNGSVTDNSKTTNTNTALGGAGGSIKDSGNSQSSSSVRDSGNSTIKDSGNSSSKSSIKDSGTSSNKNTNVAVGGEGGKGGSASAVATGGEGGAGGSSNQSQTATAENNSSGNSSSYSSVYRAAAATAFSMAAPTASCVVGYGAGGQLVGGGLSFSGGKIDKNCAILEAARSADLHGSDIAYCKVFILDKWAKKAGVTFEDCMTTRIVPPAITPVAAPQPIVVQPQITVLPAPVSIPAPIVNVQQPTAPAPAIAPVSKPAAKHRVITGIKPCPSPTAFTPDGQDDCYETD